MGSSCENIRLSTEIEVKGASAGESDKNILASYFSGEVSDVGTGNSRPCWADPIPPTRWDRSAPLTLNDTFTLALLRQALGGPAGLAHLTHNEGTRREKKGHPGPEHPLHLQYALPRRGEDDGRGPMDMAMAAARGGDFQRSLLHGRGPSWLGGFFRQRTRRKAVQSKLAEAGGSISDMKIQVEKGGYRGHVGRLLPANTPRPPNGSGGRTVRHCPAIW